MLYFVTGTLMDKSQLSGPRSALSELIQKVAIPSINQLVELQNAGRILGGGFRASSADIVMVIDAPGDSHLAARNVLSEIPMFGHYTWEVIPLESFREWQEYLR